MIISVKRAQDVISSYFLEFEVRKLRDVYFKETSGLIEPSQDDLALWDAVKHIRANAGRCSEDGDSEAGWGEMVYTRILEASLGYSSCKDDIGWKNM